MIKRIGMWAAFAIAAVVVAVQKQFNIPDYVIGLGVLTVVLLWIGKQATGA
ncbi:hypothetical protein [Rhizobium sullae]|uniref:Uncharacterized protein n=1 Tax=Rhizobium sullae TaxID=50338 RepID=A0ABY5XP84_RHISU|nr:hypothetical protein [Rhizobium sullae]UWU16315.1 hypothetical protein N2599_10195 [Rhizobium sullae]